MTASSTIASAWDTYVWGNTSIQDITPNALAYSIQEQDKSEFEIEPLSYGGEINVFTYEIKREQHFAMTNTLNEVFTVDVNYYRQKDTMGEAWKETRTALETVFDIVRTVLGSTWQSNVDYWRAVENEPEITSVTIAGEDCWQGRIQFESRKLITIS